MWRSDEWEFCREGPEVVRSVVRGASYPWWMDPRHVQVLYGLAASRLFDEVLEVGAFQGWSTSALVQALVDGGTFRLTVADVLITNLLQVVLGHVADRHVLVGRPGVECIRPGLDLVVLDGDHSAAAVGAELFACLRCGVSTIVGHDVGLGDVVGCEGPALMLASLRALPGWQVLVDDRRRPGEFTERGLMVASTRTDVLGVARSLFDVCAAD